MRATALSATASGATGAALLLTALTAAFSATPTAANANFSLVQETYGDRFFSDFYWWSYPDPTHGYVNYVDQRTARSSGLAYTDASTGRFVLKPGLDRLNLASVGRPSNRLHSNRKVRDGVVIAKISHMPQGPATWPAFWTCGTRSWPSTGEIDIIEGANDQGPSNAMTLHTSPGCAITASNDTARLSSMG